MATKYKPLEGAFRESLHSLCVGVYLAPRCYEFATAMHRNLGWPIIGMMQGEVIYHALVRDPDGNHWDCRGKVSEEEMGEGLDVHPPFDLREISPEDLVKVREDDGVTIEEHTVNRALMWAETLWPELPWKDTRANKIQHFLADLEELSRRYGIWIRGPVPAASPHLSEEFGEESGYWFAPTVDSFGFYFDRDLK